MPIYEFYCPDCHTQFRFFSRRINTETRPDCPRCDRHELERKLSVFAISKGRSENEADDGMPDIDEARMEKAIAAMAGDLDKLDENDPRAMGQAMRKLCDAAGIEMKGDMAEALRRMEAGEDPETVEAEMGDVLDGDDLFAGGGKKAIGAMKRKLLPPEIDETLYEM